VSEIATLVLQPGSPEIATCARWRVEAFNDVLATSQEAEERSLRALTTDQSDEVAIVAKLDGVLAGTCLLVRSEIDPCHPVAPWLAGLYVAPEHRRRGVGKVLVRAIEDQARQRGNARLYLYTDNAVGYYERLDWIIADRTDWKGIPTVLMQRDLRAAT
jgi:predicted N-acetyltransferase YhbS